MTNQELLDAVVTAARANAAASARPEGSQFLTIYSAFIAAARESLDETRDRFESNSEFYSRTVGNFIILASRDGFTTSEIRDFLSSLERDSAS